MTCIVGFKSRNRVFIGGDSAGVDGYSLRIRKDPKVFVVDGFLFGCTSSFRMIQLIRYSFTPPKREEGKDLYQYMCTDFIDALRDCLKKGGFARKEAEEEAGGTFLVGYNGRLFEIYDDYQVAEPADNIAAVGCGAPYALGAMSALKYTAAPMAGNQFIMTALQSSVDNCNGVRGPFIIKSV